MGMGHLSGDGSLATRGHPEATRKQPLYITVLTDDTGLIDAVREAATGHTVTAATSVEDAIGLAADGQCAIFVTDRELGRLALDRVVGQLKTYEPALVTIAVGNREDDSVLVALLSAGIVDRFMIKPLTPGPARLAIESAAREHHTLREHLQPGYSPDEPRANPRELTLVRGGSTAPFRRTPAQPSAAAEPVVTPLPGETPEVEITNVNLLIATERPRARRAPTTALRLAATREIVVDASRSHAAAAAVEAVPAAIASPPRTPLQFPRLAWLAVAGAVLVAGVVWWAMTQRAPSIDPRPIIATNLTAGDRAYAAGRFLDPAERSAAHYYGVVLSLDPSNVQATKGLDRIAAGLIDNAKALIVERRFAEATIALQNVRRVRPEHRELPSLESQLRNQLESELAAQREAPAAEAVVITNTPEAPKAASAAASLELARQRIAQGRLFAPPNDSAAFHLQAARRVEPGNPAIRELQRDLNKAIVVAADQAIAGGELDVAGKLIVEAQALGVAGAELARLSKSLSAAQADASKVELVRLVVERIEANRLIEPAQDSARYYLRRLAETDAQGPALKRATDALGSRLVADAQVAIYQKNYDLAGRLLSQARDIGFARPDLEAAEAALAVARAASVPAAPTATSGEPKLVTYVPPAYPVDARLRGYEGWVDVTLSITSLGDVVDVQVNDALRRSTFERSALDAVKQWKYEPRKSTDPNFRQTVRTRVRFALKD